MTPRRGNPARCCRVASHVEHQGPGARHSDGPFVWVPSAWTDAGHRPCENGQAGSGGACVWGSIRHASLWVVTSDIKPSPGSRLLRDTSVRAGASTNSGMAKGSQTPPSKAISRGAPSYHAEPRRRPARTSARMASTSTIPPWAVGELARQALPPPQIGLLGSSPSPRPERPNPSLGKQDPSLRIAGNQILWRLILA